MDEDKVKKIIEEDKKNAQYDVSRIPNHIHNGLDAPQLSFTSLSDTPKSYAGQTGKAAVVNTTGTGLIFSTVTTAPGGSTTQVQFNNAGAFDGDSHFTYDTSTDTLTLASGSLAVFNGKFKLPVGTNLYP